MGKLAYISSLGHETISLDGPGLYAGTANDLRGSVVTCDVTARGVTGQRRESRKVSLDIMAVDRDDLAELSRVLDRDAMAGAPGLLVVDGEWEARAVATDQDASTVTPWLVEASVSFVLVDGAWRREARSEYMPATGSEGSDLDLPHDLPCDLLPPQPAVRVIVGGTSPAHFKLVVYGHATNPYIIIGGNRYQVDATVPSGGYMVVDSLAGTVEITDADGGVSNAFGAARRGTGSGGGEYIFERLRPGENAVSWDNSFGFALTVYEEEAAPPWS